MTGAAAEVMVRGARHGRTAMAHLAATHRRMQTLGGACGVRAIDMQLCSVISRQQPPDLVPQLLVKPLHPGEQPTSVGTVASATPLFTAGARSRPKSPVGGAARLTLALSMFGACRQLPMAMKCCRSAKPGVGECGAVTKNGARQSFAGGAW